MNCACRSSGQSASRGFGCEPGPLGAGPAADLVLPDHHAEPVAVVVIAPRFDLDVLPYHVEAGGLQELDVGPHPRVRGGRQQAVWPPSLVERPPMEDRLAVEREPPVAVRVAHLADGADAGVGPDLVDDPAGGVEQRDLQIVEVRGIGRPEPRVLHDEREARAVAPRLRDRPAGVADDDTERARTAATADLRADGDGARAGVGGDGQVLHVAGRHLLEPDGLPDPGHLRVPDAAGVTHLLAAQLPALGLVLHADHHFVVAGAERVRHVDGERRVSAHVGADRAAVDEQFAPVVHGFEVEQGAAARSRCGPKRPAVPQRLGLVEQPLHASEPRLQRERNEDPAVPGGRRRALGDRGDRVVPVPVQVLPPVANQLRTRILGPRVPRRHLLAPGRDQLRHERLRRPLGRRLGRCGLLRDGVADGDEPRDEEREREAERGSRCRSWCASSHAPGLSISRTRLISDRALPRSGPRPRAGSRARWWPAAPGANGRATSPSRRRSRRTARPGTGP